MSNTQFLKALEASAANGHLSASTSGQLSADLASPPVLALPLTPLCNTGVESASGHSPRAAGSVAPPERVAFVDYLRFSFTGNAWESPEDALEHWQRRLSVGIGTGPREYDAGEWEVLEHGHHMYRRTVMLTRGIKIYYDGSQPGMGICVEVSGQGCRELESRGVVKSAWTCQGKAGQAVSSDDFGWERFLSHLVNMDGVNITRLDIALDDRSNALDLQLMKAKAERQEICTRLKKFYPVLGVNLQTGEVEGITLNFGSRESAVMVRAYDKAAEQGVGGSWNRVELEAKGDHAHALADAISSGQSLKVVASVIRKYVDFKEVGGGKQKCRWETSPWWQEFLGWVEKTRLTVSKAKPTLSRVHEYLRYQVAPSLATVFHALDQNMGVLLELLQEGTERLKRKHTMLIGAHATQKAQNWLHESLLPAPATSLLCLETGPTGF
jgi:phage replication initiation protein